MSSKNGMTGQTVQTDIVFSGAAKKTKISFALIYFLFMSARAIFNPFVTVYLQEKGLPVQSIGFIVAANSLIIIVAQPFWGLISDKLQSVKQALIICLVSQGLISLLLIKSEGFFLISVFFCVYTFFSSPEGTLLDTWSLRAIKLVKDENAFGHLKLWGCLGFAMSSVFAGYFISRHSTGDIIPVFSVVLIALAVVMFFIKIENKKDISLKLKISDLSLIVKDKPFLLFLLFIVIMQYPHRAAYTFYPALVMSLGGTKDIVGYCSAIMFVSEALILFFSKSLLSNIAPQYLIMGSSLSFILWQFGYTLVTKPVHVMLLSLMDGPSFALFTVGTLYYMDKIAPAKLRITYQTVAYASYFGVSGIIGNTVGGMIINRFGYRILYLHGIAVIAVSTVLFYLVESMTGKKKEAAF
jgi:MFS family permease